MYIKNLFRKLKQAPKKVLVASAIAAAVILPSTVWAAWGPERPVFDYNVLEQRAGSMNGPVFNSFINTPDYGDERNFTTSSPAGTAMWTDANTVTPGGEYEVRVFVHNNANPATNGPGGVGEAVNTRVRVDIPEGVANGFDVAGYVSADNATPHQVFDSTLLKNDNQAFAMSYVPGSARIYTAGAVNGAQISDDVVGTNGTQIGFNSLNGVMPGCFEYQAVVTVKVKIEAPALKIQKQVTTPGSSEWHERLTAKVGDTVSWLITFNNTGSGVMNDVTIRDTLPNGVELVPGSIRVFDPGRPAEGEQLPDTALGAGGVNLGNYGPGGGGFIRFRTVVTESAVEDECKAKNIAYGRATNVPEQSEEAEVVIENCEPVTPTYSCDSLSQPVKIGDKQYRFTVNASAAGGATIKQYRFNFGDGTAELLTDNNVVEHTYAQAGNYAIVAKVDVDVNGEVKTAESMACKTVLNIDVPEENCPIPGKTHLPKNSPECKTVPATLPVTGPGDLFGIFAAVSVVGMVAYRFILARKYS